MQYVLDTRIMIAFHLVIVAALMSFYAYRIDAERQELSLSLTAYIERELEALETLITLTDRNEATPEIAAIISDCSARAEFERLLTELGTLGGTELLRTQQLFAACGSHFANQKALMVDRMQRELAELEQLSALYTDLHGKTMHAARLSRATELVAKETERSYLLSELVTIQESIIAALIRGERLDSREISELVEQARSANESLAVLDKQIDSLRVRAPESL